MQPFHVLFPEIARREVRTVQVRGSGPVPPGEYSFVESYCTERDCDCQSVLLTIFEKTRGPVATINYRFGPGAWKVPLDMPNPLLDPFNPQSKHSAALLDHFNSVVLDEDYRARLESHYRMVKAKIQANPHLAEHSLWEALSVDLSPAPGNLLLDRRKRLRKLQRQARRTSRRR